MAVLLNDTEIGFPNYDTSSETRMYGVDMDGKGRWWMYVAGG